MVSLPLMKALEVNHISYSYYLAKYETLKDVSFTIDEGEYISIVGPNGSGKSTLARLLVGLLNASGGSIYVQGTLLEKKSLTDIRKKVGMIFQNPDNQFIGATVEDDIAFGLENRNVRREEMPRTIQRFSKKVGMEDYLSKEPINLSGGQKQRVAIASMLALNPEIIIMDEATSMLDPTGRKEIRELVEEIKKENPKLTVISITHDVEEASMSDRVLLLVDGKVSAFDTPKRVFSNSSILKEAHLSTPFFFLLEEKLKEQGIDINKEEDLLKARDNLCR